MKTKKEKRKKITGILVKIATKVFFATFIVTFVPVYLDELIKMPANLKGLLTSICIISVLSSLVFFVVSMKYSPAVKNKKNGKT